MGWGNVLVAVVSPLVALAGVMLGAGMSAQNEAGEWLREQRLTAYLDYLDNVVALSRLFRTDLGATKFHNADYEEADPVATKSYDELDPAARESFERLLDRAQHAGERLQLLGGPLVDLQARQVARQLYVMHGLCHSMTVTVMTWNECHVLNVTASEVLREAMRVELLDEHTGVLARWTAMRPRWATTKQMTSLAGAFYWRGTLSTMSALDFQVTSRRWTPRRRGAARPRTRPRVER